MPKSNASLQHLLDRNVQWVHEKTRTDPGFFTRLAEQQRPRYLWIGCSDSRVTANDVLRLDPGEVFVHRNIANIAHTSDLNMLAVLEYAVSTLHIEHIMVVGHYGCGGIERVFSGERSALVDYWLQPVVMLYRKHKAVFDALPDERARINRLCEINVAMQVRRLAQTPLVENTWARGERPLHLHGWIYGLEDGLLRDLGTTLSSRQQRDAAISIDDYARQVVDMPASSRRLQALDAFGPHCACEAHAAAHEAPQAGVPRQV